MNGHLEYIGAEGREKLEEFSDSFNRTSNIEDLTSFALHFADGTHQKDFCLTILDTLCPRRENHKEFMQRLVDQLEAQWSKSSFIPTPVDESFLREILYRVFPFILVPQYRSLSVTLFQLLNDRTPEGIHQVLVREDFAHLVKVVFPHMYTHVFHTFSSCSL